MASRGRRGNHRPPRAAAAPYSGSGGSTATRSGAGKSAWLAPPIGVAVIVGLAFGASRAQATAEIFVAAGLLFSLCEGIVLAIVGWAWSRRGVLPAIVAASATAALAAPARWEVAVAAGNLRTLQPTDLLVDLLVSIAWGAMAGLAGATILRPKLSALMHTDRERFS